MWARYDELGKGNWNLLWVGGIRRQGSATQIEVEVHFAEDQPRNADSPWRRTVWRPIEEISQWGLATRWINGRCAGYAEHDPERRSLHVIPGSRRFRFPRGDDPPLLSESDYKLFSYKHLAGCWTFQTIEGIELVVPGWQILQAWYLFDKHICPAVIAGILDVSVDYGTSAQPWRAGTSCTQRHVQYCPAPQTSPKAAQAFSRLLFDPVARMHAMDIHKRLMSDKRASLPMIGPPHSDVARWTFRCREIAPNGDVPRLLLLYLESANVPLPFDSFSIVARRSVGSDEEPEEGRPIVRTTDEGNLDTDSELPLVGGKGGGARPRDMRFKGLAFCDDGAEKVPWKYEYIVGERGPGVSALVIPPLDEEISGLSMVTGGVRDPRIASVRPEGPEKPPLEDYDMFERTRRAFQAVVDYVSAQTIADHSWQARLICHNAEDCFLRIEPSHQPFLILELEVDGRYVYAVDALRKDGRQFAVKKIRNVDATSRLSTHHFQTWLRDFPGEGSQPWDLPLTRPASLLLPSTVPHQSTKLPKSIEDLPSPEREEKAYSRYVDGFRDRLITHLTSYVTSAPSPRVRRTRRRNKPDD